MTMYLYYPGTGPCLNITMEHVENGHFTCKADKWLNITDTDNDAKICVVWNLACEEGGRMHDADCALHCEEATGWHYQVKCNTYNTINRMRLYNKILRFLREYL